MVPISADAFIFSVQSGLPPTDGWEMVNLKEVGILVERLSKSKKVRQLKLRDKGFSMPEAEAIARAMVGGSVPRGVIWVEFRQETIQRPGHPRRVKKALVVDEVSINGKKRVILGELCLLNDQLSQGTPIYFKN